MKKQPTALAGDVFAGLFTRGVVDAGFKVIGDLEHSGYGSKTAQLNFPGIPIRIGPHTWRPEDFTGRVDFMYCNPPCAAWSSMRVGSGKLGPSNTWREETERLQYVRNLTNAGLVVAPKAWAWESVTNAWRHGRDFVMEQAEVWANAGWHVTILLQNNKYLGGNQHRPRMFLIAHRHSLEWQPFVEPPTLRQLLKGVRAVRKTDPRQPEMAQSLKTLWKMAPHYGHVLRRALLTRTEKELEQLRPRPAMTVNRCKWDQTPGVFIGASKRLHPDEPRTLSWPEVLRVCGLPSDWQTANASLENASLECSRAVMPGVGKWLALSVKAGLARPAQRGDRVVRLVDLQDPEHPHEEVLWKTPLGAPWVAPPWDVTAPEYLVRGPKATNGGQNGAERASRARQAAGQPTTQGSGYRTRCLLLEGKTTEQILATIHAEYPSSKATSSDVSWNRYQLRLRGNQP